MATRTAWPDVAIPPGETLAEELQARRMSQSELARRMGRPVQAINEIVRGVKLITPETALQLEEALEIPGDFWLRLEANYRYNKARIARLARGRRARWDRSVGTVTGIAGSRRRRSLDGRRAAGPRRAARARAAAGRKR